MVTVGGGAHLGPVQDDVMRKLQEEYEKIVEAEKDAFAKSRKEMDSYVEETRETGIPTGNRRRRPRSPGP